MRRNACGADDAELQNAKVETRAVSGPLDVTFQAILAGQQDPAWIAYAEPAVPGDRQMCCSSFTSNSGITTASFGCSLEPNEGNVVFPSGMNGVVRLQGLLPGFRLLSCRTAAGGEGTDVFTGLRH